MLFITLDTTTLLVKQRYRLAIIVKIEGQLFKAKVTK